MKRKVKSIAIIAIVGFVATILLLTGCDNGDSPCSHIGGPAATCTTAQTCTECGVVMQAAGHLGLINAADATCTEDGNTGTGICTRAGCEYEGTGAVIPAFGHDWNWNTYVSGSGLRKCHRSACTVTAGIGHTGPAGGVIFYSTEFDFFTGTTADDNTTVTRYYLEAWTSNESSAQWSSPDVDVPAVQQVRDILIPAQWIGYGRRNTKIIVAAISAESGRAAQLCDEARHSGFDDWFLPSVDELNALGQIRGQYGIPLSIATFIWSSSQFNYRFAMLQNFGSEGVMMGEYKNYNRVVRAVRAF